MEAITERYGALLRGYLAEVLTDRASVDDVTQLTMIDVWRRGPTFDPARASVTTWLLMIARSRAIDHLRRRVPEPFDPETVATFVDRDSEDEADRLLERWRVAALISQLPKNEGRLLAMRFYDGLSQSQIAERTGLPLGTVKLRMRQAFTRLREAIDHEEGRR